MSKRFKKIIFAVLAKITIACLVFNFPLIPLTNASFTDQDSISGNQVSTGCWVAPTIPQLIYPENGYLAGLGSDWLANPYMDWSDSSTTCPGGIISYEYESYHDSGLTSLAYRSGLLSNSMIPALGTPDGTYYWRVRAFDGSNWSDWSEVWLLTVDRSVPPPSPGSDNSPSGTPATSPPFSSVIVINEILPDPVGIDVSMTNDEWVELYNRSDSEVNVAGWYLYDASDSHELPILGARTDTGDTKIPAHGFLVVYRAGDSDFVLDQDAGGDTVRLYDGLISTGIQIDSHMYTGPVAEGKSIARYPDGSDAWYDPIPTPGGPNKLEPEGEDIQDETQLEESVQEGSEVDFGLREDKKAVWFETVNVSSFDSLKYEIIYDSSGGERGMIGEIEINGQSKIERQDLALGTCSTLGQVCVYDQGITKIKIKITLIKENGEEKILEKVIDY